ncbi:MAG: trigger factor [Nitrospirota bacterium]|nr:trigger factor [Nitrospirota bacterium]
MSTTIEDLSSTSKRLKVEIPADVIEKEYKSSLDNIRQRARIPGFRPGKSPVSLIEKKFGDDIRSDLVDRLVPEYLSKVIKEADLTPVTMPRLESALDIKRNEPLIFSFTIEVRPVIGELNYTGLKVEEIETALDDSEIEDTLKGLQQERAVYEVVEREIKGDDLLVIDFEKLDESGGNVLSSGKDQVMDLSGNLTPPGILENLTGKKKGDVVEIDLPSFEGGDKADESEQEKGNTIRITIKEVKEKNLPGIDDEFARDFGCDTLDALREKIREGLLLAKKGSAEKQQKEKLYDILVESHEFDVPESLLEKELERLVVNEKLSRKKSKDLVSESRAETGDEDNDDSGIVEEVRPKAVNNVKASILLDMIAEKEGITVTDEEMGMKLGILARELKTTPEVVKNLFVTKDGSLDNFRYKIRDEKVLDVILSKAEITKGE